MHLVHSEEEAEIEPKKRGEHDPVSIEMALPRRSLYILSGSLRYNYTHQIYAEAAAATSSDETLDVSPQYRRYTGPNCYSHLSPTQRRLSIIVRDSLL
jgi:hypothetical protein